MRSGTETAWRCTLCIAVCLLAFISAAAQTTCTGNCRSTNINHSHLEGNIFESFINVPHMENPNCLGFNFCPSGSPNGGGCLPFKAGNGKSANGGTCELLNWEGSPVYYDNAIFNVPNAFPAENFWESGIKRCDVAEPPPGTPMSYAYPSGSTTAEVAARIAAAAAGGR